LTDDTITRAARLLEELHEVEPALMANWVHGMEAENRAHLMANLIADVILALMVQKLGTADGQS